MNCLKMDDKNIILDKFPSYAGITRFIKIIFLMNFVRAFISKSFSSRKVYPQWPMSTANRIVDSALYLPYFLLSAVFHLSAYFLVRNFVESLKGIHVKNLGSKIKTSIGYFTKVWAFWAFEGFNPHYFSLST
jgi:hypothetical protein